MGRASAYCSATFVVAKKAAGKYRLIIDMRPYNAHCADLPVHYDDLRSLKQFWARPVHYLFSFDIKDGYHHFGIHPAHRRFFQW